MVPSPSEFSTAYCDPTVEGFVIVSKAEIDVFLDLSCFFNDPADVGDLLIIREHNNTRTNGNSITDSNPIRHQWMAEGRLQKYISMYRSHSFFINAKMKKKNFFP